ncbi:MAG: amino acid adenylation domain-containing protein [Flavobacteriales bacterium]|jgi:amino acid adenylation domain-containing protein
MEINQLSMEYGQQLSALTERQLLIWTGANLAPDVPVSNMLMTFQFDAAIDVDRFQSAFAKTLHKTDILRTVFVVDENKGPWQKVFPEFEYGLELIDLSRCEDPAAESERWITQETIKPFDLSQCCFRSALLKLSENTYLWYFCQHHLITDGATSRIVYERVHEFYEGTQTKLSLGDYPYSKYLQGVDKYRQSKSFARDEQYWHEKLSVPVEPLRFNGRPLQYSAQTQRAKFSVGQARSLKLKAAAADAAGISQDFSIFVMFTSLIYASLHLVSGNKRIGLGAPMHNRSPKYQYTAGLMMEVCPLVIEFDDNETFASLADKVKVDILKTMRHSQFCTQNPSHAKIFDVSLNFLNQNFSDFDGAKTKITYETGLNRVEQSQHGQNDWTVGESLSITVNDFSEADDYLVYFDFNSGVFDQDLQEKYLNYFDSLLDSFLESQVQTIDSVDILSTTEKHVLLESINDTRVATSETTVIQALENFAQSQPEKIAVVFADQALSYKDLNARVNVLAKHLIDVGVGEEVSVGIFLDRSIDLLVALLATMKSGGAYVPFDPHHPADRIELILEDAQPKVLLHNSSQELKLNVDESTRLVAINEIDFQVGATDNISLTLNSERLAYTIFTSGSTGRPKGVQIAHSALNNFLHSMAHTPGLSSEDRLLSVTTISFDIAALEIYLPILVGASVDIADQSATLDPEKLQERLASANFIQATPATFRMLLQNGWAGDKKLKVLCGGEAFPRDLADELLTRCESVWNMYGPTETTIWSTIDQVRSGNNVPIGTPIDNTQVYILNSARVAVPQGCIGELYIAGDGLARGYHGRPDLTHEVFVNNPFSKNENSLMYRTGDLARILPDGRLECLGRVDFQVKLRGFRIELGEIETCMGKQEEVAQNVVVVKGEGDRKSLVCFVALSQGVSATELRNRLKSMLPPYMVPSLVVILDELPLTPNGKVDRKQLPEPDLDALLEQVNYIAPESNIDKAIAAIWSEALGVERVGIDDNFFDIGGHSLLAVRMVNRINELCVSKIDLNRLFDSPTIRELSQGLELNVANEDVEKQNSAPTAPRILGALTPRQLLMWAGYELAPNVPSSNMVMLAKINGSLDVARFGQAFKSTVNSTDALRLIFKKKENGEPLQEVSDDIRYDVEFVDFSSAVGIESDADACSDSDSDDDSDREMQQWISREAIKPFDLGVCAFKCAVLKRSESSFVWYMAQHHLITDGSSVQAIYDRTNAHYSENVQAASALVAPDYREYLNEIDIYQNGSDYKRDEKYWLDKLATPVEPIKFYGRAQRYSARTERLELVLGKERSEKFKKLAGGTEGTQDNLNAFVVFATVLYANLFLVSGNKRIGMGTPMHNRPPKYKNTAGLMMEVSPLIVDFDEAETFSSLMAKIKSETFEAMVASRFTTHNPTHSKIYDVALNFLNPVFSDFGGHETEITHDTGMNRMPVSDAEDMHGAAGEALNVTVSDFSSAGDYHIYFDFNSGIFDEELQGRLKSHFVTLLDAFIESPETELLRVNLLSEREKEFVFDGCNNTTNTEKRNSVIDQLEYFAAHSPESPAVYFLESTLTYTQLNSRVNMLANHLISLGVGPDVSVGIFMERSLDLLVGLLATMKSGGAYVPFDPHHPADRIELILEDAKPKILLHDVKNQNALNLGIDTQAVSIEVLSTLELSTGNPSLELDDTRLAYTIFTSGSTGRPKGVQIVHASLNNFLHSMARKPGLAPEDRLLSVTTISFDIAALEMYLPILVGASVDIADQDATLDPTILQQRLTSANVLQATPATYRMLIQGGWPGDKQLKVLCGGEAFPRDLADELLTRCGSVWNMYGPTETTIWSTIDEVRPGNNVPIGEPIDNTQVYILNSARVAVPQGCIGELFIAGDGLARGYHGREDLTQEVFVKNPFSENENALMYRTGDLARILPDGRLECLGRVDFQVKLRGFRIELGEIESLLGQQKEVDQNVVVVKGDGDEKRLVGYISVNTDVCGTDLRGRLKESLPAYMVPAVILTLDTLPLTPNGKIDRKQLPAPQLESLANAENFTAACTETELKIESVWAEILGLKQIGIDDDFFEIGGHSLSALRALSGLNDACGSQLSLNSMFETPTIRELARRADCNEESVDSSVITLKQGDNVAPLFCICGIHLYQALADNIQSSSAVYGVFLAQETEMWQSADAESMPTIEELATLYLKEIRAVQPQGPYRLAGVSFGGVLAYEIAQQFRAAGDEVKILGLFDAILPHSVKKDFGLLLKHHIGQIRKNGIDHLCLFLKKYMSRVPVLKTVFANMLASNEGCDNQKSIDDKNVLFRRKVYLTAMRAYDARICDYDSRAIFFSANDRHEELIGRTVDDGGGWKKTIKDLEIVDVNGRHITILSEPNVLTVAKVLDSVGP